MTPIEALQKSIQRSIQSELKPLSMWGYTLYVLDWCDVSGICLKAERWVRKRSFNGWVALYNQLLSHCLTCFRVSHYIFRDIPLPNKAQRCQYYRDSEVGKKSLLRVWHLFTALHPYTTANSKITKQPKYESGVQMGHRHLEVQVNKLIKVWKMIC